MDNGNAAAPRARTETEERAILCRLAHDAWLEECRAGGHPFPFRLPRALAPVARAHALDVIGTPDAPHRDRFRQVAATLGARGASRAAEGNDASDHADIASTEGRACVCCVASKQHGGAHFWSLRHRFNAGSVSTFDPETQLTTIKSTLLISAPPDCTPDNPPRPEQVDELMAELGRQFDPRGWKENAKESFKRSEQVSTRDLPQEAGLVEDSSWSGTLLEGFQWAWNAEAPMTMENLLDITYLVTSRSIHLDYSLDESLSSTLWLASQTGGLDFDRGSCDVEVHDFKELDVKRHKDVIPLQPYLDRFVASPRFNIVVRATKTLRFTPLENGPDWLSVLLNYTTPVIGGIWMSRAVHTATLNAIEKVEHRHTQTRATPERSAQVRLAGRAS
jgi:hypothetical protein